MKQSTAVAVNQFPAHHRQIFIDNQSFYSSSLKTLKRFKVTITSLSSLLRDIFKELLQNLLLMNKPDIPQHISGQLNCLIKSIKIPIRDIHNLQNQRSQSLIKQIRLCKIILELCRTSKN